MTHYEVQHFTICEGWINTWNIENDDGDMVSETFDTYAEAQAALNEFLDDIAHEIAAGTRDDDTGYGRNEFRIVAVNPEGK